MKKASKLSDTDLCVMCGMCLPHCPTYQLYQTETESPRGRLALMQSIDQGKIKADSLALKHIDHCLGCLNCQTICPSKVPYGKLIDEFREQFSQDIHKPLITRQILKHSALPDGLEKLCSIVNIPVLKYLLKPLSSLSGIPSQLTNPPAYRLKSYYPASNKSRGDILLFTGCAEKLTDSEVLLDCVKLLNQLSYDVSITPQQTCCGALHQHNGQQKLAKMLLKTTESHLAKQDFLAILFFSPACGALLQQLKDLPVQDVRSFLYTELQQHKLDFSTPDKPVALHESCSHRNMLRLNTLNFDLLSCIPDIEIIPSKQPLLCCGAGGLQSINYPEQANSLLTIKLESFDFTRTDLLISDNIGCSLHIKSALSAYNTKAQVIHPVSLLARQLLHTN